MKAFQAPHKMPACTTPLYDQPAHFIVRYQSCLVFVGASLLMLGIPSATRSWNGEHLRAAFPQWLIQVVKRLEGGQHHASDNLFVSIWLLLVMQGL